MVNRKRVDLIFQQIGEVRPIIFDLDDPVCVARIIDVLHQRRTVKIAINHSELVRTRLKNPDLLMLTPAHWVNLQLNTHCAKDGPEQLHVQTRQMLEFV